MMDHYNHLLNTFVNLPYDELVTRAKLLLPDVYVELSLLADDGDGTGFLFALVGTGIVADEQLSDLEYLFLCDTLGIEGSFAQAKKQFETYFQDDWSEVIFRVLSGLSDDARVKLAHFVLCFLAVDERISVEENSYMQLLFT